MYRRNYMLDTFSVIISLIFGMADILFYCRIQYLSVFFLGVFLIFRYMSIFINRKPAKFLFRMAMLTAYFSLCIISGGVFAPLVFFGAYTVFVSKENKLFDFLLQAFVPTTVYCICNILNDGFNIGIFIGIVAVFMGSIIYSGIYYTVIVIFYMREKMEASLVAFALSELEQKNLNRELAVSKSLIEKNIRLEERENISRDIHNSVGHTIMASIMAIDAANMLCDVDIKLAHEKLEIARERMGESMENVRCAVRILDDGLTMTCDDFKAMLTITADRLMSDTDIHIYHNFADIKGTEFDKKICEFLNSVFLEALTNGIKHGGATFFSAFLETDLEHIRLTISDNGDGFECLSEYEQHKKLSNGFGLKKIRSYCEHHGGSMIVNGDNGFMISVSLPINIENGGQLQ